MADVNKTQAVRTMKLCDPCMTLMEDGFDLKTLNTVASFICECCKKKRPYGKVCEVLSRRRAGEV